MNGQSNHIVLGVSGYGIIGDTQYYNTKSVFEYYKKLKNFNLPVEKKQRLSKDDLVKRTLMFQVRGSIPATFVFPEPTGFATETNPVPTPILFCGLNATN